MTAQPTITTAFDMDDGCWRIYAESYGRVNPAGPRLFRAAPWPDVRWEHPTEESAQADAQKLRAYLDSLGQRKGPSKAKLRKLGAD